MDAPYYGWFSQKSVDAGHSTSFYRDDKGQEFEITCVSQDPDYKPGWEDAVCLGVVGQWSRHGRPNTTGMMEIREEPYSERLLKPIKLKHSVAQIEKILAAADEAGLVVDDCPAPIIVNMEKNDGSDHAG